MIPMSRRGTLTRERIVAAAAAVADRSGIVGVSMRTVGKELGVEGMSLYHHLKGKEELLDALAAWAFEQIDLPPARAEWRPAMEQRAHSARRVLRAHPWAIGMLEARPDPSRQHLRHHDRVLGWLFDAGFSAALATHAFSAVDAFIYGFALSESTLPFEAGGGDALEFAEALAPDPVLYPNLVRGMKELQSGGSFSYADEFDVGLALILDSVELRWREAS